MSMIIMATPLRTRPNRGAQAVYIDTHRAAVYMEPAEGQPVPLTEADLDAQQAALNEPAAGDAGHACSELLSEDWDGAEIRARMQVDDMLAWGARAVFYFGAGVMLGSALLAHWLG